MSQVFDVNYSSPLQWYGMEEIIILVLQMVKSRPRDLNKLPKVM